MAVEGVSLAAEEENILYVCISKFIGSSHAICSLSNSQLICKYHSEEVEADQLCFLFWGEFSVPVVRLSRSTIYSFD